MLKLRLRDNNLYINSYLNIFTIYSVEILSYNYISGDVPWTAVFVVTPSLYIFILYYMLHKCLRHVTQCNCMFVVIRKIYLISLNVCIILTMLGGRLPQSHLVFGTFY